MRQASTALAAAKKRKRKPPLKKSEIKVPDNWRSLATLTIVQTSVLLGLGRNETYEAVKREEIPAIRVGRSWRVPVPRLVRMLEGEAA
jgi:excisionase family DNA binding protein